MLMNDLWQGFLSSQRSAVLINNEMKDAKIFSNMTSFTDQQREQHTH